MDDEKTYRYAVLNVDEFTMHLAGELVVSENKVFTVNEAQNNELKKLIESRKRPDITQNLQLIDQDAAEKIAREHMAAHRGAASQGAHNSTTAKMDSNNGRDLGNLNAPPGTPLSLAERLKARTGSGSAAEIAPPETAEDHTNKGPQLPADQLARQVLNAPVVEETDVIHPEEIKVS